MPGLIKRETTTLLPTEEALVEADPRHPNRPGSSDPVGLVGGPNYLVYSVKPPGPGVSVLEGREDIDRRGSQFHRVPEAHGSSVEE